MPQKKTKNLWSVQLKLFCEFVALCFCRKFFVAACVNISDPNISHLHICTDLNGVSCVSAWLQISGLYTVNPSHVTRTHEIYSVYRPYIYICARMHARARPVCQRLLRFVAQRSVTSRAGWTAGAGTNKLSGHPCRINEGDGRTWQPKHVKTTGPWKGIKGPTGSSAGWKLTPSDKTWHPL